MLMLGNLRNVLLINGFKKKGTRKKCSVKLKLRYFNVHHFH